MINLKYMIFNCSPTFEFEYSHTSVRMDLAGSAGPSHGSPVV